jgi:hypothetical protein
MNETSLQFHIEANDYFGTLATVLDLLRQDLDRRGYKPHAGTLSRLRDDLVYLQRSHRIEKSQTFGLRKRKTQENPPSSPLNPVHLLSTTGGNQSDAQGLKRQERK